MSKSATSELVKRARALAYFTILYNLIEAGACAFFGIAGEALSLLGFGSDSLLEAASGAVVLWRMKGPDAEYSNESADEHKAHRIIGWLFLTCALALTAGAIFKIYHHQEAQSGLPGIIIAGLSLACMLWLYRAKRQVATALNSPTLRADAFATLSCMWMSGLLLAGSLMIQINFLPVFDGITTLAIAFLLAREGWEEAFECDH